MMREQPVIGFMIGNSFLWSDVLCLFVGTCVAVLLDAFLLLNDLSREPR